MATDDGDALTAEFAARMKGELAELQSLSRSFGSALGDALEQGIVKGGSLGDVLRTLGLRLTSIALSSALKPVETAFGSIFANVTRGALGGVGSPVGGAGLGTPNTLGGGLLPAASQRAVPAPAAAPLAPKPQPVTVNIATPDAESFRRAEAQVSASLARAVARGRRGM